MFRAILIAICLAVPVWSHILLIPNKVCRNRLVPQDYEAQNTEAPYNFSGENSVRPGETIRLKLKGDADYLLGYMIKAQDEEGNLIGSLKIVDTEKSHPFSCSAEKDNLVHVDKKRINSATFEWLAPDSFKGKVRFVGTVAKNAKPFWVLTVTKDITVE